MNKQIEELAKEIESAKRDIWASVVTREEDEDYLWHSRRIAEHLTSLNYQRVNKNSIMITEEELKQMVRARNKCVENKAITTRKKTAKEILQQLNGHGTTYVKKWIKEQYGVEIKND